jgi:hypothetical protein
MTHDDSYKQFELKARAVADSCDAGGFYELSALAVSLYQSFPDRGEDAARIMTGIWVQNSHSWDDKTADDLGQLFADLDLPPHHVTGGEIGARRKWHEIQRTTESLPGANSQAA